MGSVGWPAYLDEPATLPALLLDHRDRLPEYAEARDRVDLDGTTRLSAYLKIGSCWSRDG